MPGFLEYPFIFIIGGLGYGALELIFRGYTHWSMLLIGGVCFCAIYRISELPIGKNWEKWLLGSAAITAIEFVGGLIVNIWLGWNVWSYSQRFLNLLGQVCPLFTLIWFLLCIPAMALCEALRSFVNKARPFPREQRDG